MGSRNPCGDLDQMSHVGRYGGHNHVCNIWWLSVKGCGCGERGKFAFSHWLHASPLQHYRVTVWWCYDFSGVVLSAFLIAGPITCREINKSSIFYEHTVGVGTYYSVSAFRSFPDAPRDIFWFQIKIRSNMTVRRRLECRRRRLAVL